MVRLPKIIKNHQVGLTSLGKIRKVIVGIALATGVAFGVGIEAQASTPPSGPSTIVSAPASTVIQGSLILASPMQHNIQLAGHYSHSSHASHASHSSHYSSRY